MHTDRLGGRLTTARLFRAAALVSAALLAAGAAAQLRPFLEAGVTRFGDHGDGVWYQEAFAPSVRLTAPAVRIGARTARWSFGYAFLGCAAADSLAVSDENYDAAAHRVRDVAEPPVRFRSSGCVQGLFAQRELLRFGATWVDAGVMVYRPTHRVDVGDGAHDWHSWRDWNATARFTVTHRPRLEATPLLAGGMEFAPWSLLAIWYPRITGTGDPWPPLYHGSAFNFALRYTLD